MKEAEKSHPLTPESILELARGFQPACVLIAAAELDAFSRLKERPMTAAGLASRLGADPRATAILLDALAALGLLSKEGSRYDVSAAAAETLVEGSSQSGLEMVRHLGNCLRRWAQLAFTVKSGTPPERAPSIRGADADLAAFIHAMDEVSRPMAAGLVACLEPRRFQHFLDVGGASGTWTIAFLRAAPGSRATLFDLPEVIPMARDRLAREGLIDRVSLAAGDFYRDPLPCGADLVWLGAIVHQNSREENRALFAKALEALEEGGRIAIRDMVMDPTRTRPVAGALFAVNMLAGTPGGGTYTFEELGEDLRSAGFADPTLLRQGEAMDSIVVAAKRKSD